MDLHLRDLRYFVAVAEELHFTRAAERLHVSQPALSRQIRLLERHLRCDLFVREPRVVRLTTAGEVLLTRGREVLDRWDVALAAVNEVADRARRVLVVGIQTSVGRDLQRRTLAGFTERQPDWRLSLRLCPWDDPAAGLTDGTSDVAFVWLPTPDDAELVTAVLYTEPRWVALPDDHRLADQVTVPWSDLLDEGFIALPPTAGTLRDFWLATDHRPPDRPPHVVAAAANAEETFELIAAGVGVALLSAGNARIYQRPGVRCVAVPDLPPSELAIARRRDDRRPALLDLVAAAVAASAAPR
ncbi:MAG TPA: LysR family transcriptional regulator [Acidimicrobiales bacterium]|nr:LysR family transcriptional regulator [Acidimicrobiales bacterium]